MRALEQATFAELEHDLKKRRTRREVFLETMEGWFPGSGWRHASSRSTRRPGAVGGPIR